MKTSANTERANALRALSDLRERLDRIAEYVEADEPTAGLRHGVQAATTRLVEHLSALDALRSLYTRVDTSAAKTATPDDVCDACSMGLPDLPPRKHGLDCPRRHGARAKPTCGHVYPDGSICANPRPCAKHAADPSALRAKHVWEPASLPTRANRATSVSQTCTRCGTTRSWSRPLKRWFYGRRGETITTKTLPTCEASS